HRRELVAGQPVRRFERRLKVPEALEPRCVERQIAQRLALAHHREALAPRLAGLHGPTLAAQREHALAAVPLAPDVRDLGEQIDNRLALAEAVPSEQSSSRMPALNREAERPVRP